MSRLTLIFWGIFKEKLNKYQNLLERDRLVFFILIIISALLLSFKTTSGQGQDTLLGKAIENYFIEETAAFINLNLQPEENDFFLSQSGAVSEADSNTSGNIFQESFLPYQSILSVFDNGQRNQVVTYTVQPDDTLSQIANDFGVSANSLIWANNLKDRKSRRSRG